MSGDRLELLARIKARNYERIILGIVGKQPVQDGEGRSAVKRQTDVVCERIVKEGGRPAAQSEELNVAIQVGCHWGNSNVDHIVHERQISVRGVKQARHRQVGNDTAQGTHHTPEITLIEFDLTHMRASAAIGRSRAFVNRARDCEQSKSSQA